MKNIVLVLLVLAIQIIYNPVNGKEKRLNFPDALQEREIEVLTNVELEDSKEYSHLQKQNYLPKHCGIQNVPGTHPWIAKLGYAEVGVAGLSFSCAGVLINKRYVVTAAVCLNKKNLGGRILTTVHLGDDGLSYPLHCRTNNCKGPKLEVKVEDVIPHPEYTINENDIGLVRLSEDVDFSDHYFEAACMVGSNFDLSSVLNERSSLQVAGWSIMYGSGVENDLQSKKTKLEDALICKKNFGVRFHRNKQICVKDNCMLSGSPMLFSRNKGQPLKVVGIASLGTTPCGLEGNPAIYTSIAYYSDWIVNNIAP